MGLLKFGLLCTDFVAWPMLALAYPLYASIRAIETGSKYHMRKLVTYWTVLSIVSLFEHTLRVMEWVPLWPYMKLVCTFWLVVPRFNGACYAYDCLVNADLGAKLHCILSQISHAFFAHKHLSIDIKAMEQTTKQGTKETKSKDFESMEQTRTEGRKSKEFKAMEQTTEQGITEERKVKSAVDNIGQMRKQETEAPWVKGIPVANAAEEKIIPDINSSKLIQREWTCAVCQVTTTSENNLKLHLEGKKHRTNCAELKPIKRVTRDPGSCSPKATDLPNQVKNKPAKHAPAGGGSKQETNVKPEKATGLPNQVTNESAKHAPIEGEWSGKQEKVQANASGIEESTVSVSADPRPYCSICNIWFLSEADVASHLKGRKHLSKLKQMGIWMANEPANHTPAGGGSKEETNVKPEKATGLPNQATNESAKHAPIEDEWKQKTSGEQEKVQANASGIEASTVSVSADPRPYCSICNIWFSSEAVVVSHLKGRKHLSKLKQMGIWMVNEPANHTPAGGGSKEETNVKPEKAIGLPNQATNESAKHAPIEDEWKQKTSGEQEKVQANASGIEASTVSVSADPRPYCSICNIWFSSEAVVVSHLKGRKHLSKLKQMGIMIANEPAKPEMETGLQNQDKNEPAKPNAPAEGGSKQKTNASVSTDSKPYCIFCNIWPPCEAALVAHLKGRKHLSKLKQMGILMV